MGGSFNFFFGGGWRFGRSAGEKALGLEENIDDEISMKLIDFC